MVRRGQKLSEAFVYAWRGCWFLFFAFPSPQFGGNPVKMGVSPGKCSGIAREFRFKDLYKMVAALC